MQPNLFSQLMESAREALSHAKINELFVSLLTERPSLASREAKQKGLVHVSFGNYARKDDPEHKIVAKSVGGRLVPVKGNKPAVKKPGPMKPDVQPAQTKASQLPKPIRAAARGRGRPTPGGDADVKLETLRKGFSEGHEFSAPGNPGSALNEILTGEGIHRIRENPALVNDPQALADALMQDYGHTTLAKQNSDLRPKLLSTAKTAIDEYKRINEALFKNNWDPQSVKIDHYYGAVASKKHMFDRIDQMEASGREFQAPNGKTISFDDLREFIKRQGTLVNPSDTAVFAEDKDGSTMVFFTSNKLNTDDTFANSTIGRETSHAKDIINNLVVNGEVSEKVVPLIHKMVDKTHDHLQQIQRELEPMVFQELSSLVMKNHNLKHQFVKSLSTPRTNAIEEKGRKSNLRRWATFKKRIGVANDAQATSKFFQMLQDKQLPKNGILGKEDVGKLISRQLHGIPGVPSTQQLTAKLRGASINALSTMRKSLNKFPTRSKKGLGDVMEAHNIIEKFHLSGALGDKSQGVNKYEGLFSTSAGGTRIDTQSLRKCLGIKSKEDFIKGFSVSDPIPAYDKEGNITGARFEIFQVNQQNGQKIFLGNRFVRSKKGATGKLETAYKFHRSFQNCLKGKTE